jgi:rRNA maturation endonuclease Nob1
MRSLAPVQTEAEPQPAVPPDVAPAEAVAAMPDDAELPEPRRSRAVLGATLASVVWLGAAAAAIYLLVEFRPPADLTLTGLAGLAAGVTAPLSVIWLIALVLGRSTADERRAALARVQAAEARVADIAARTRQELAAIDGVLAVVADRVEAIRGGMGQQASQLMDTAARLEERSRAISGSLTSDREAIELLLDRLTAGGAQARAELAEVIAVLPQADERAKAIAGALAAGAGDARRQLGDIDGLVAASRGRSDEARATIEAAAERLTQAIAAIDAAGAGAAERLTTRAAALTESADTALDRTAEALDATRQGIEAQVAAVRAGTEQARVVLQGFGGEATRQVTERFTEAATQAERLTREMAEQEVRSRALIESVERGFGILDAKLANAAQSSSGVLDRLNERLNAVRDQMHELATPLGGSEAAARELENRVTALRATAAESVETLSVALPEQLAQTSQSVATVRDAVGTLAADIATLNAAAAGVTVPIQAGRTDVEAMVGALDRQRDVLAATVAEINRGLEEARVLAAGVDADAQRAALTATTRLIESMTRVREVAAQAEGTMRTVLEGVVAEAREAVASASQTAMHETFTKRVRVEIAEVEAVGEKVAQAAQATAERLSRQMISVAETAAAVEARIAQADARLDAASQDDLARRSGLLIEALNSASIDIAKALSTEVADTAWAAYLRGDRSIFTRRAVRLLDGGDARAVARRYGEDPEFRDSVSRYVHDFEALMRRTLAEREGGALSVALLSSDVGKLYVALAQALERIKS